jgi:hypothetical protein
MAAHEAEHKAAQERIEELREQLEKARQENPRLAEFVKDRADRDLCWIVTNLVARFCMQVEGDPLAHIEELSMTAMDLAEFLERKEQAAPEPVQPASHSTVH